MKLNDAVTMRLEEAKLFIQSQPLLEDGEGPRWSFKYDNFNVDPTPDILLLGAYTHPNTGNNLVGGINTHYLDTDQINKLAVSLPKIMAGKNLKQRYWIGRELMPDVFTDYYRTYDSKYIRGVKQDVMYPKFGIMKTAGNWLKKKVSNIFKSKQQREIDAQPKYPDDLKDMQDRLNDVVVNLQKKDNRGIEPETPEMQRAREAFQQFQRDKTLQRLGIDSDDLEMKNNLDDFIDKEIQAQAQPVQAQPAQAQPAQAQPAQAQPAQAQPAQAPQRQKTNREIGQEMAADLKAERQKNQAELLNPNNDIDPDADLSESITYYSPIERRYVTKRVKFPIHG